MKSKFFVMILMSIPNYLSFCTLLVVLFYIYFHFVASPTIYHRDVKVSKILLDDKFIVKVADFGIPKLGKVDATYFSTGMQGTLEYLDFGYFQTFHLIDKSDVYGFGMVLLELITSLKLVDLKKREEDVNLTTPFIPMGVVQVIVDTRLFNEDLSESCRILMKMQQLAKLGIQMFSKPLTQEAIYEGSCF